MENMYKIVMLPTDNTSEEVYTAEIYSWNGKLYFKTNCNYPLNKATPQHLYILSDEEIKLGHGNGYVLFGDALNLIEQVKNIGNNKYMTLLQKGFISIRNMDGNIITPKIIASTDSSLELPGIPQEYIEYYIKESNSGNKIEEIKLKGINPLIESNRTPYKVVNNEVVTLSGTINNLNSTILNLMKKQKKAGICIGFIGAPPHHEQIKGYKAIIDISTKTIEEMYTEDEVTELLKQATINLGCSIDAFNALMIKQTMEWWEENKK